jgi:hypothetical protein
MVFFEPIYHKGFSLLCPYELYSEHDTKSGLPPHHALDKPHVSNMTITKSVNVQFFLSAISFDSGE